MVGTIEEKISVVIKNIETIPSPVIKIGSDAYLDKVLHFKAKLDTLSSGLADLSEDTIVETNKNPEYVLALLPRLKQLHLSCLVAHDSLKKSILDKALVTSLAALHAEVRNLRELIDDIVNIHVTMKGDEELQLLFSQL